MAKVTFKRVQTNDEVSGISILDGQLIYSKQGKTYMDYGTDRVPINGTTDTAMSDSSTNPVENRVIKSYVDTNIATLDNKIDNGTILWTNPDPSVPFAGQTLTLSDSLDNYDCYEILYAQDSTLIMSTGKIPVGYGTIMSFVIIYPKFRLTDTVVSGSTITFEDGKAMSAFGSSVTENQSVVPTHVIAYKTGLNY